MEILWFSFSELGCPQCCKCEFKLAEIFFKKKGLVSYLLLTCKNCGYSKDFYTSVSNDNSFDLRSQLYIALEHVDKVMQV